MTETPSGYAGVRRALEERGYLATPLERLFLGGIGDPLAGSRRGRVVSALIAGALGGLLLGILLAGVLVLEGRGSIPAWPDGILYAVLFAPVLGVLIGVTEAVAAFVIRAVARVRPGLSPRAAALAAGLTVALVLSLYLGWWWVRGGAAITGRDLVGLAVLAVGAGFAGRIVSAAALVQAALAVGRAPRRPRPRLVVLLGGIALAGVVLAALVPALLRRAPEAAATAVPREGRFLLVGWDGLDLETARGYVRVGGPAPGTSLLARSLPGASPVLPPVPWDPAAGWTTVATGCLPARHGATGLQLQGLRGAESPLSRPGLAAGPLELLTRLWPTEQRVVRSGIRRVPAFWEVTALGAKTAVIGWWGTWPAASPGPKGGYVVSDAALVAAQRGRGLDEAVFPGAWGAGRAAGWLEASRREAPSAGGDAFAALAREARVADLFALAALEDAARDPALQVLAVYLPGLDILRDGARRLGRDPFETLDALRAHVAAIDARLAALAGEGGASTTWLVGLPGRAAAGQGFLAGPGGAPVGGTVPAVALAPTLLARLGLPVDDRMDGPVLGPDGRVVANAPRHRTAAEPAAAPPAGAALEDDVLERLRSLGYVQ